jgi:hypothetical protein
MIKSSSVHNPIHRRWFCMHSSAMFDALTGIVQPCRAYNVLQPATAICSRKRKRFDARSCHMLGLMQFFVEVLTGSVSPARTELRGRRRQQGE